MATTRKVRLGEDINISFLGLEATQLVMKSLNSKSPVAISSLEAARNRAVKRFGFTFQSKWKKNLSGPRSATQLGVKTGNLRRSIRLKLSLQKGRSLVYTESIYSRIHEVGGTIRAKRAPYLVFVGSGGHLVKTKQVTIPQRPHFGPTQEALKDRFPQIQDEEVKRALRAAHAKGKPLRKKRAKL
jgi:phage gpG-like protein